jgi:exopolysaccharide production protein ExoY
VQRFCPRADGIFVIQVQGGKADLGTYSLLMATSNFLEQGTYSTDFAAVATASQPLHAEGARIIPLGPDFPVFSVRYAVFKTLFDFAILLCLMPVLLPLCALIALAVWITSPGPIFFRHARIGRFQDPIGVWKFRTMYQNGQQILEQHLQDHPAAREEWALSHKLKVDPRITPLGRFLRKTSLDELPQFLNVLHGEMSLIGPRPIVKAEVEKFGSLFEVCNLAKPGITGLWQVSGRSALSYDERVLLDASYVSGWSLLGDVKIFLKTFTVVLRGTGAY